jgi:hypothetical protein
MGYPEFGNQTPSRRQTLESTFSQTVKLPKMFSYGH